MTDSFVVTYQPDVSRTLYEKPPVKKTLALSFEEAAAVHWLGHYLFGNDQNNHMTLSVIVSQYTKENMAVKYDNVRMDDVPDSVQLDDDILQEFLVCVIDQYKRPTDDQTWYEYLYSTVADNQYHPRTPQSVTKQYTVMLYNPAVNKKRALVLQFSFLSFYSRLVETCRWFGLDPSATIRHFHMANASFADPEDLMVRTQPRLRPPTCKKETTVSNL